MLVSTLCTLGGSSSQIARRQGYCFQECDEEDIVDIVPFVGVRIANIPS